MTFVNCTLQWCRLEDEGYSSSCPIYAVGCDPCRLIDCRFTEEIVDSCWEWACYAVSSTTSSTTSPPTTTTASPSPRPPSSGDLLTKSLVGGFLGGIACLLLVYILIVWISRRRRSHLNEGLTNRAADGYENLDGEPRPRHSCISCHGWLRRCRGRCLGLPLVVFHSQGERAGGTTTPATTTPLSASHSSLGHGAVASSFPLADNAAAQGRPGSPNVNILF